MKWNCNQWLRYNNSTDMRARNVTLVSPGAAYLDHWNKVPQGIGFPQGLSS